MPFCNARFAKSVAITECLEVAHGFSVGFTIAPSLFSAVLLVSNGLLMGFIFCLCNHPMVFYGLCVGFYVDKARRQYKSAQAPKKTKNRRKADRPGAHGGKATFCIVFLWSSCGLRGLFD